MQVEARGTIGGAVTHILGVRAFGTQLLCEQVIGRALRRQNYELNEDTDLFDVEYADVFGIPFDFTAKPVVVPPPKPRETVTVKALRPQRDYLEIQFPRVQGYRVELPEEQLEAEFNDDHHLTLTPDMVGATKTHNAGIIGEAVELDIKHLEDVRQSTLLMELTKHLLFQHWRDQGQDAPIALFGQLKRIVRQWLEECLECKGATYPAQLTYPRANRQWLEELCALHDAGNVFPEFQQRLNRDLDPQLIWRGKDQQDWSDLVVNAPPLYIQEKVKPKVLIDDLRRETEAQREAAAAQQDSLDLFGDFNGLPEGADRTDFYQHEGHWQNRMILGDSLQVMASLAEREGLRGKVQCIYFDPPYGIKFNSNFQWSTNNTKVKDGNADHITREPEQVKAFRDTWKDGIHSYLP